MAIYSFLITGEGALEVATVFNHSLNNQMHLTTNDGVSFSLHSPLQDVNITSTSPIDDDNDTIHLNVFIFSVLVVIVAVGLILILGLSVGM